MHRIRNTILALLAVALLLGCQAAPSPTAPVAQATPPTAPTPTTAPTAPTATPAPTATTAPSPTAAPTSTSAAEQVARAIPATAADVPRITLDELQALIASPQQVVVLDTRSPDEYAESHIPGAANMPVEQVGTLYSQLPRGVKLVAY